MPVVIADRSGFWDHYAEGIVDDTPEEAIKNAFGWTQYEGHGPGDELLGDPLSTLELGCGRGNAVAALATKGVEAVGIDISPAQVRDAERRWVTCPARGTSTVMSWSSSAVTAERWDAVYSIWGALWFADPSLLLPMVHHRLAPGGKLVFAHAPAVPGSYGVQGMYGNGFKGRQVWIYSWAHEPGTWADLLHEYRFADVHARIEPAPEPDHVGTLIVEARRPL